MNIGLAMVWLVGSLPSVADLLHRTPPPVSSASTVPTACNETWPTAEAELKVTLKAIEESLLESQQKLDTEAKPPLDLETKTLLGPKAEREAAWLAERQPLEQLAPVEAAFGAKVTSLKQQHQRSIAKCKKVRCGESPCAEPKCQGRADLALEKNLVIERNSFAMEAGHWISSAIVAAQNAQLVRDAWLAELARSHHPAARQMAIDQAQAGLAALRQLHQRHQKVCAALRAATPNL